MRSFLRGIGRATEGRLLWIAEILRRAIKPPVNGDYSTFGP